MIELTRVLVRQFRAVLRKSVPAADPRGPSPPVLCQADRRGLTLSCRQGSIGVRHHTPGSLPAGSVAVPFPVLAELESAVGEITLEQTSPFKGRASWQSAGEPRVLDFDAADPATLPPAPESARNAVAMEPGFLAALDEAARTAGRDVVRFATNFIQLRGRDGAVVATDGRQLLLQAGFRFPWKEDYYLPALPAFGGRELPRDGPVKLGLAKGRVTLEVGPWLFDFKAEDQLRFPDAGKVIPDAGAAFTRLRLDARDIEELIRRLPRLPGHDEPQRPVTLDLGDPVAVRARLGEGEVSEVVLSHSGREGPALRVATDRRYLVRALQLGFAEVMVANAKQPLLCKDAKRTYVWMPLSESDSVPAATVPHAEPALARRKATADDPETVRGMIRMPANEPKSNGQQQGAGADQGEAHDPITEAEELRVQLQAALARTARLIAALKQQRRQGRVVQTALDSLRRLQKP